MPNVTLTENLRATIKTLRKEQKIRGDKLAKDVGKSASYISQIENGKIKEIDFNLLDEILKKISLLPPDKYDDFVKDLIDDKLVHLSSKELKHEKWLQIFNYSKRMFPINEELKASIQSKLNDLNYTPRQFVEIINQNRGLDDSKKNTKPNVLNVEVSDHGGGSYGVDSFIVFNLPSDFIENILSGKIQTITYINMQGILYNLYCCLGHSHQDALELSKKDLYNNQFYTLKERNELIRKSYKDKKEENKKITFYDAQPTDYDKQYVQLRNKIDARFDFLRDKDIIYTCKHLSMLLDNMDNDFGLTVAIMSSPLYKIPKDQKQNFWNEYVNLINNYIPNAKNKSLPE